MGLMPDGYPCHVCEGPGAFHRLVIPIRIVAATDLDPAPDVIFQRMAVMSAECLEGKVILRGVTDRGMGLTTSMSAERWARNSCVSFVEEGLWY
jgi:hypothetical protein